MGPFADETSNSVKSRGEPKATVVHCEFCFDTLLNCLDNTDAPKPQFPNYDCPLFVTWNKTSNGQAGRLRGCIGTLQPKQLHMALAEYAIISALKDARFMPVERREVPMLSCTVSLLTHFELVTDWLDWQVGLHGVIARFPDPSTGRMLSATFLPEVALNEGWDQRQCIDQLIRKAGCSSSITDELRTSLELTRYQSSVASLSYEQYLLRKHSLDAVLVPG